MLRSRTSFNNKLGILAFVVGKKLDVLNQRTNSEKTFCAFHYFNWD